MIHMYAVPEDRSANAVAAAEPAGRSDGDTMFYISQYCHRVYGWVHVGHWTVWIALPGHENGRGDQIRSDLIKSGSLGVLDICVI